MSANYWVAGLHFSRRTSLLHAPCIPVSLPASGIVRGLWKVSSQPPLEERRRTNQLI
jgi:hypothetical protein